MATPKQRVLVRWNDDLDKSLLLFIAHTCNEMGIKIPYEEVARRMGSTFTAGAIQQHITKLRNKMAGLNVVPVPPPPRRGRGTRAPSRPSTVTTMDSHQLPTPTDIFGTVDSLAIQQSTNAQSSGVENREAIIKRSESDIDEEDEDVEHGGREEYVKQASDNLKRKRSGHVQDCRPRGSRVNITHDQFNPRASKMTRVKQEADDELEADFVAPELL